MAEDGKMMNGEFSVDRTVDIAGDEISIYESKVAELSEMIEVLEREKQQVLSENETVNDKVEKMMESVKHLSSENEELKAEVEKLGSENRALQNVAARAAELEGEVSRLQHDLISAMSDLQDANGDIAKLRSKVEGLENGEMEKSTKIDAVVSERDLLIVKVEGLEAEVGAKEKEIRGLEGRIEELKLAVREKEELERKVREFEGKLEEKEGVINGLEAKQREIDGLVNAKEEDVGSVVEVLEKKNCTARLKGEWPMVAVSSVSAVMQLKLIAGNSAGTVTTFYLSSQGQGHDEIDFEFLGNSSGQPYTLHTNVYAQGNGGREQRFSLWFDPTTSFHTYSIVWNSQRIIFLVDNIPIRVFNNQESNGVPFPKNQAMRVYCSLWNADDWATQGGSVKTDWTNAPFTVSYRNFNANGCVKVPGSSTCGSTNSLNNDQAWQTQGLDAKGRNRIRWVQQKFMIYNYCTDAPRFPQGFPSECRGSRF